MSSLEQIRRQSMARVFRESLSAEDFSRIDEGEDTHFHARPRFVQHLDRTARNIVSSVIAHLVPDGTPRILDLMASGDSHLPTSVHPAQTVGLGLNAEELSQNVAFDPFVVQDLNRNPVPQWPARLLLPVPVRPGARTMRPPPRPLPTGPRRPAPSPLRAFQPRITTSRSGSP